MRFVLQMARRETRASWKRLIFFFLCVAIGVGTIVAIRSVIQTTRAALVREARTLIAADVIIQTNRPWESAARQAIERRIAASGATARTEAIETATMVRPADDAKAVARMVELQGVEPAFPLYGAVTLADGRSYAHRLLVGRGALVRPELLTQLGLNVGDQVRIGTLDFTIRGVVVTEPGRRPGAFSFGSRVLVDAADLQRTGLITFGSRVRYMLMLKVPDGAIEALVSGVRSDFGRQFITARSYRSTEDQIGEDLQRAEDYLSLVGFVMVVLGGIGVWSVTRVFVRQKMRSIAVLKCVGASSRQLLAVYVAQVVLLGLCGSAVGVLLAAAGLRFVPESATAFLGGATPTLTTSAVAQGTGIGLLVSLLFSLVPLLDVRSVKPLWLLREDALFSASPPDRPPSVRARVVRALRRVRTADRAQVATAVVVSVGLVAIAAWQAGSLKVGVVICLGFVALVIALHGAAWALIHLVRPLSGVRWFPLRHAVIALGRPGNQTRVILVAVGLGAFFIIGVRSLQSGLLREFSVDLRSGGVDLFLIDIQPSQASAVREFLGRLMPGGEPRLFPVLRARVTGVRGRSVNLENFEDVRGRGSLAREYVLTYRDHLEANETMVDGRFWPSTPSAQPEVSIEESIRDRFDIQVGDLIRFDILGRIVEARVTSIRRVEWSDTRSGGFMFVFRPGALERAPQTLIGLMRGPADPTARARLQRDVVARFPNVSVLDVFEIAKTVERVLGNVTLAVTVVGAIALLSGLLIVVGAVAMTKFERLHDTAVFKTLGASTRTIACMLVVEYGTLGLLAGAVGACGAAALTWVVSREVLDIRWLPAPGIALTGTILTGALVALVGVLASGDVLRRKPLSILRAE